MKLFPDKHLFILVCVLKRIAWIIWTSNTIYFVLFQKDKPDRKCGEFPSIYHESKKALSPDGQSATEEATNLCMLHNGNLVTGIWHCNRKLCLNYWKWDKTLRLGLAEGFYKKKKRKEVRHVLCFGIVKSSHFPRTPTNNVTEKVKKTLDIWVNSVT